MNRRNIVTETFVSIRVEIISNDNTFTILTLFYSINHTDIIMILTLILTLSIVFHLYIILNQGRTTGRTHLDHVRLSL